MNKYRILEVVGEGRHFIHFFKFYSSVELSLDKKQNLKFKKTWLETDILIQNWKNMSF